MKVSVVVIILAFSINCLILDFGDAFPISETIEGRQGILEIPKQIATIIRNTIDESLERVFSTTTKRPRVTPRPLPPKVVSSAPSSPKPTRPPTETFVGQYIIDNLIITPSTAQPPVPVILNTANNNNNNNLEQQIQPVASGPTVGAPIIGALSPDEVDEYVYILGVRTTPTPTQQPQQQAIIVTEQDTVTEAVATTQETEYVDVEETSTVVAVEEDPDDPTTVAATTTEEAEDVAATSTTEISEDADNENEDEQ